MPRSQPINKYGRWWQLALPGNKNGHKSVESPSHRRPRCRTAFETPVKHFERISIYRQLFHFPSASPIKVSAIRWAWNHLFRHNCEHFRLVAQTWLGRFAIQTWLSRIWILGRNVQRFDDFHCFVTKFTKPSAFVNCFFVHVCLTSSFPTV